MVFVITGGTGAAASAATTCWGHCPGEGEQKNEKERLIGHNDRQRLIVSVILPH
jgi:hypothetical protein